MSRFFSRKFEDLTPYVPGEQPQGKKYIKLNTNENPYGPSPLAVKMADEEAEKLRLYSDPDLRELIKTASEILGIPENMLIFTNGSDEILNFAFMAFSDKENPAVFPNISYGFYSVFAEVNGIPYEEIPLNEDFSIDAKDYIGINKNIFIANPNAPTGLAMSKEDIEKIVASNPDNVVVIDEAYVDFGGESVIELTKKYDNLLVCRTFSKSRSLAGARLGIGIASPEIIRDLNTIRFSTNPYNVNRMTMAAGIGALKDTAYFEENVEKIKCTRDRTAGELRKLGFILDDSKTNFLFAKHPDICGKELYLALREKGILVRHFDKELIKDYNRISIGTDAEMDALIKAVKEILEEKK